MNWKWTGSEPEVNRKWPGSENRKWVGSGMQGIYKRRVLAPCDFCIPCDLSKGYLGVTSECPGVVVVTNWNLCVRTFWENLNSIYTTTEMVRNGQGWQGDGRGWHGIHKRRALAPCDFFRTILQQIGLHFLKTIYIWCLKLIFFFFICYQLTTQKWRENGWIWIWWVKKIVIKWLICLIWKS